tara:strand:+ start:359 stop:562 length:204 start_codon:yes stop_codon:yes gene_type:complete
MAKLESAHNSTSISGRICALHRALHCGLDFDVLCSIDPKSTQHERHVGGADGPSESDFVYFALIGEK